MLNWRFSKLLVVLLFCGCTTLAKDESVVICQTADAVTTLYGLSQGLTEANPLLAAIGPAGMIALKVVVVYFVLRLDEKEHKTARATASAVGCGAAIRNIVVLRGL